MAGCYFIIISRTFPRPAKGALVAAFFCLSFPWKHAIQLPTNHSAVHAEGSHHWTHWPTWNPSVENPLFYWKWNFLLFPLYPAVCSGPSGAPHSRPTSPSRTGEKRWTFACAIMFILPITVLVQTAIDRRTDAHKHTHTIAMSADSVAKGRGMKDR